MPKQMQETPRHDVRLPPIRAESGLETFHPIQAIISPRGNGDE